MGIGTDIHIIKSEALDEDLVVDESEAIKITRITQSRVFTIGTVNIKLMKSEITFYVVHSDFPISANGILRRE